MAWGSESSLGPQTHEDQQQGPMGTPGGGVHAGPSTSGGFGGGGIASGGVGGPAGGLGGIGGPSAGGVASGGIGGPTGGGSGNFGGGMMSGNAQFGAGVDPGGMGGIPSNGMPQGNTIPMNNMGMPHPSSYGYATDTYGAHILDQAMHDVFSANPDLMGIVDVSKIVGRVPTNRSIGGYLDNRQPSDVGTNAYGFQMGGESLLSNAITDNSQPRGSDITKNNLGMMGGHSTQLMNADASTMAKNNLGVMHTAGAGVGTSGGMDVMAPELTDPGRTEYLAEVNDRGRIPSSIKGSTIAMNNLGMPTSPVSIPSDAGRIHRDMVYLDSGPRGATAYQNGQFVDQNGNIVGQNGQIVAKNNLGIPTNAMANFGVSRGTSNGLSLQGMTSVPNSSTIAKRAPGATYTQQQIISPAGDGIDLTQAAYDQATRVPTRSIPANAPRTLAPVTDGEDMIDLPEAQSMTYGEPQDIRPHNPMNITPRGFYDAHGQYRSSDTGRGDAYVRQMMFLNMLRDMQRRKDEVNAKA